MIDATVLIPTHRHTASLPYAVQSALDQEGVSIELFVVGDGVEDDTRAALAPFRADPRVRFFDFPKGERHGERNRHAALEESAGRIVCYLCDDDLLLASHVATMLELLENADFAHSAPLTVTPGDVLTYFPIDLAQASQQARLRTGDWNAIGLSGAAHTLDSYRRLPWGWRPAPAGVWTDLYMWWQFLDLANFRGVTGTELTHLHFPNPLWRERPLEERMSSLVAWWATIRDPAGRLRLARQAERLVVEKCATLDLLSTELSRLVAEREQEVAELLAALATVESTRTWRLRSRLLALRPVRAVAARRPSAR